MRKFGENNSFWMGILNHVVVTILDFIEFP